MSSWFELYGFARVGERLLVGAYPTDAEDVARIARGGATAVFNLCEDREYVDGEREAVEAALREHGIEERRMPLVDYGGFAPDQLDDAIGEVEAWLGAGRTVYLHCRAGYQRSATVAAGVVAEREGLDVRDALIAVRDRKPTARPLDHQAADLLRWWARKKGV
jgi:protein-tyrosine phosphatase